ncbi:hypothetical protein M514_10532 [Trichuris suis]|uniref:DDE-1 domain-containing protein n=1 Tax=Trichuris suis TaxID=68888 RepID=A0A085N3E3_9BILA|nr:hypothetical protein M513_10532 [Trichuris suis]KFD63989.1 hypothetical protein M514_10532 [Trichuris suis]
MDQGVIATLKLLCRKELLRYFLLPENSSIGSVISFYKKMTLKDCCFMIAECWYSIKQSTLRNASNYIFINRGLSRSFSNTDTEEDEVAEILDTIKHLSILDECNMSDTNMWLACDEDAGFHVLNDDEIVATVSDLHGGPDEEEEEE